MPRSSGFSAAVGYARLLRQLSRVRNRADWALWVHGLGYRVGRVEAAVRLRTPYF